MTKLLDIKNLSVQYQSDTGTVDALKTVSLSLERGDVLRCVGQSGCGAQRLEVMVL